MKGNQPLVSTNSSAPTLPLARHLPGRCFVVCEDAIVFARDIVAGRWTALLTGREPDEAECRVRGRVHQLMFESFEATP